MNRFDLIDEYTCLFVPTHSRSGATADVARRNSPAGNRPAHARWASTLAGIVGLAILVVAAATL